MLEARLREAGLLKRITDSLKDLVTDFSFEFTDEGLKMQAMDSSHVSLCVLTLDRDAFDSYRCDKPTPLGLNLSSLTKVLKCAQDTDSLTLKSSSTSSDQLSILLESRSQDKVMEFNLKLLEIDEEALGIPEQTYASKVSMNSSDYSKVVKDLSSLGESVVVTCQKDGVTFSVEGDIGSANITLKSTSSSSSSSTSDHLSKKSKNIKIKSEVKKENMIDSDSEIEEDEEEEEEDRNRSSNKIRGTEISVSERVELTFALRYLKLFSQATPLSERVNLSLAPEIPLLVEFVILSNNKKDESENMENDNENENEVEESEENTNMEEENEKEGEKGKKKKKKTTGEGKGKRKKKEKKSEGSGERKEVGKMQFYLAPKIDDDTNTPTN